MSALLKGKHYNQSFQTYGSFAEEISRGFLNYFVEEGYEPSEESDDEEEDELRNFVDGYLELFEEGVEGRFGKLRSIGSCELNWCPYYTNFITLFNRMTTVEE